MATSSPREGFAITHRPDNRSLSVSASLSDEAIWKRLQQVGFDEDSIKRRDKAALIAYISKLEAELLDHQHHMGLLILEKKKWSSMYEMLKASAESMEIQYKCLAAKMSPLGEARKREDNLKRTLEVEKECIKNIEKAMHEIRAESAETKIAAKFEMAEAQAMVEKAQKLFTEAGTKLHAAESLQAEATCCSHDADRKLQKIEAHEEDLKQHITAFKFDCDSRENEFMLERLALSERQRILQQGQERLLDGKALLNQREDHIFSKIQDLNRLKKELEAFEADIENERAVMNEEKSNLNLRVASLSTKEQDVIKKEIMLQKKEQDLLILQEKLASKAITHVKKLEDEHKTVLKRRMSEIEAEMEMKCKMVEDDIDGKKRAWELMELDFHLREEMIVEREHESETQSRALADKENHMREKLKSLEEMGKNIKDAEKEVEFKKIILQKEQEEINNAKLDIEKSLNFLEDRRKQVACAKENVEAMKTETDDLMVLEVKLKEEIDMVRAEKLFLMANSDELRVEKAKFEAEWESIDEKREELRKEAECIAAERLVITAFLKDERDSLKLERDAMRAKYNEEMESLRLEREDFMSKMVHERSQWFSKTQQERADFLLDTEMQKRELENRIEKMREELESDFLEREQAFELQKTKELEDLSSRKEAVAIDLDYAASEMKRLETERVEIKLDRERRDREWSEINNSIEDLTKQRQKLKKQRELLHADRKDIHTQIDHLKNLEQLRFSLDSVGAVEMQQPDLGPHQLKNPSIGFLKQQSVIENADMEFHKTTENLKNGNELHTHSLQKSASRNSTSAPLEWIKRCTQLIFKHSPEKSLPKHGDLPVISVNEKNRSVLARKLDWFNGDDMTMSYEIARKQNVFNPKKTWNSSGEPKVILEVPSAAEDVSSIYSLVSEVKKYDMSTFSKSSSGIETLAGMKRSMNSSSNVLVDALIEGNTTKKTRYQEDIIVNLSEESITNCVVSMQGNELRAVSMVETEGVSEQSKAMIVDDIIKVSEVSCFVNTESEIDVTQHELDHLQSSLQELDHDSLPGEVTTGYSDSTCMGNGRSKSEGMIKQILLEDDQQFTEQRNSQKDAVYEKMDQLHEDHGLQVADEVREQKSL